MSSDDNDAELLKRAQEYLKDGALVYTGAARRRRFADMAAAVERAAKAQARVARLESLIDAYLRAHRFDIEAGDDALRRAHAAEAKAAKLEGRLERSEAEARRFCADRDALEGELKTLIAQAVVSSRGPFVHVNDLTVLVEEYIGEGGEGGEDS